MTVDEFLERVDKLPDSQLITEQHLGVWLSVSVSKLQKDRVKGEGPKHVKVRSGVRYKVGDVREYIAANTHASTSTHFATHASELELGMVPYAMVGGIERDFFDTLDQNVDQIVWR